MRATECVLRMASSVFGSIFRSISHSVQDDRAEFAIDFGGICLDRVFDHSSWDSRVLDVFPLSTGFPTFFVCL